MDWNVVLDRAAKSGSVVLSVVALLLGWDYVFPICKQFNDCSSFDVVLAHEIGFGWLVINGAGSSVFYLMLQYAERDKERRCIYCQAPLTVSKTFVCPKHGALRPEKP